MKLIAKLAAALMLAALPGPLLAQAAYDPDKVITSVTLDDLRVTAETLGQSVRPVGNNGDMLLVESESYFKTGLQPKVCQQDGVKECKGVLIFSVFSDLRAVTDAQILDANNRFLPVKVSRDARGNVTIRRYLILDYGATMRNLQTNIIAFQVASRNVVNILKGEE
ncbi:MAG: hypothetical protein AAF559_14070 [Pseudomonadota bacterium]